MDASFTNVLVAANAFTLVMAVAIATHIAELYNPRLEAHRQSLHRGLVHTKTGQITAAVGLVAATAAALVLLWSLAVDGNHGALVMTAATGSAADGLLWAVAVELDTGAQSHAALCAATVAAALSIITAALLTPGSAAAATAAWLVASFLLMVAACSSPPNHAPGGKPGAKRCVDHVPGDFQESSNRKEQSGAHHHRNGRLGGKGTEYANGCDRAGGGPVSGGQVAAPPYPLENG